MLDFERIKQIPIGDVCGRYGISLRFRGDAAVARCPLPTHKEGDKDLSFSIKLSENYWRCFSKSCNERCGKRGGDVISFVALKDGISDKAAAEKLSEWFNIPQKKAEHSARPTSEGNRTPTEGHQKNNSASGSVKIMQEIDVWFAGVIARGDQEDEEAYLKRLKGAFKGLLIKSFKNGQRVAAGLQPLPLVEA